MTISLLKLLNQYEPLQKARKAGGQFIAVHDWIKQLGNSADPIESAKRSQAKRQLSGAGKISPEDFKQIADNRNIDLIGFLADRGDLTTDQAKYILNSDVPFKDTTHHFGPGNGEKFLQMRNTAHRQAESDRDGFSIGYGRGRQSNKKAELYEKLIPKAIGGTANWKDFLKTTSEDALFHVISGNHKRDSHYPEMSSSDLFHIITERPKISKVVLERMTGNTGWGQEHVMELLNRPESHLKQIGLNRSSVISPQIINAVFRSGDANMITGLLQNSNIDMSDEHLKSALVNPNPQVAAAAANNLGKILHDTTYQPDRDRAGLLDLALDRLNPEHLKQLVAKWASSHHKDGLFQPSSVQKEELLNHAMANPHVLLNKNMMRTSSEWTPDEINKIAKTAALMTEDDPDHWDSSKFNLLANLFQKHSDVISEDTIKQLLASPLEQHGRLLPDIVKLPAMTPELIDQAAHSASLMSNSYRKQDFISSLVENPKASPDTVVSVVGNNLSVMSLGLREKLATGAATPRALWEQLAFNPEDTACRMAAAKSPQATSEDVTKGLADPEKNVRLSWIKYTPTEKLTPEHWAQMAADKAPTNRSVAVERNDLPPDLLKHFLLKDKVSGVNLAALTKLASDEAITDDFEPSSEYVALLNDVVGKMNPNTLTKFSHPTAFSQEQTDLIKHRLVEDKAVKMAKLNKQLKDGTIATPDMFHQKITGVEQAHNESLENMSRWKNLTPATVQHILSSVSANKVSNTMRNMQRNDLMQPSHWDSLLDRPDLTEYTIRNVMQVAQVSPERWRKIAEGLNPAKYSQQPVWQDHLASNSTVPVDVVRPFVEHGNIEFLKQYAQNNNADPGLLSTAYNVSKHNALQHGDAKYMNTLLFQTIAEHPNVTPELLTQMYDDLLTIPPYQLGAESSWGGDGRGGIRERIVQHPRLPVDVLHRALNDPSEDVQKYAMETVGQHDPDMVNGAIGGHEIFVNPAVEKLKDLKGQVEALGGTVNKKDLPNKGQNIPPQMLDGKGNVSTTSVDQFIDKLPKDKYNVSYSTWNGAQRHDRTREQKVLQLNMTNAHVNAIKEAGLWDVFSDVHKASYRSGHPVRKHSLGWARIDDHKPGHWHIDEIQSDLGQGSIRMVEVAKEKGQISPEKAEKYINGIKSLVKIFSGSFKNINHAIHAAVHQAGREKGITTTSMDDLYDQAKQSNMQAHAIVKEDDLNHFYDGNTNEDSYEHGAMKKWAQLNNVLNNRDMGIEKFKEQLPQGYSHINMEVPLPGFMNQTYKQIPEDYGYKPANKKEVMPETQSPEETVQFRKLVKSLKRIHELVTLLKIK